MITAINQTVKVGVIFEPDKIQPRWFIWNNKRYEIKQVTYTWKTVTGETEIMYFSVTDGSTLYELSLNKKSMKWNLEKASME